MKQATIILTVAAALLSGCKTGQTVNVDQQRNDISWAAFCAARGYDLNDNSDKVINEYLDAWCGSAPEEAAFIAAGVQPY